MSRVRGVESPDSRSVENPLVKTEITTQETNLIPVYFTTPLSSTYVPLRTTYEDPGP